MLCDQRVQEQLEQDDQRHGQHCHTITRERRMLHGPRPGSLLTSTGWGFACAVLTSFYLHIHGSVIGLIGKSTSPIVLSCKEQSAKSLDRRQFGQARSRELRRAGRR